jgi:Holliday junction DNA helicase, RuvA subunit
MYNHIKGVVSHKYPSKMVLETNGIGWDITLSLNSSRRLPSLGQEATVLVHLIVREDDLRLIGFADEDERALFRRLIDLSGVGPSMALQILSGMSPQEFAIAVERQDAAALKKIKGVGEKTAKRIILELKGAKTLLPQSDNLSSIPGGTPSEAVAALVALGISANEAAVRVEKVLKNNPDLGVEDLIKAALR